MVEISSQSHVTLQEQANETPLSLDLVDHCSNLEISASDSPLEAAGTVFYPS